MRERPPEAGALGPILDTLEILAQPTGAALVAAIVAWARSRRSHVTIDLTGSHGQKISIDGRQLATADTTSVGDLVERLGRQLDAAPSDRRP